MKQTVGKYKIYLEVIVSILAIIGFVVGAIPNVYEWWQNNSKNPAIEVDIRYINIEDSCKIVFYNYGNENAKGLIITTQVYDEYNKIIAKNNSINFPILSKPLEGGSIIWEEIIVRFDEPIFKDYYKVKVIIEGENFATVEKEAKIEIL